MRQIKVYIQDTTCERCGVKSNRKRAEAEDWIEIVYVDQTGMPVTKSVVCNSCSENWVPDAYMPVVTPAPTDPAAQVDAVSPVSDTPTVTLSELTASALAALASLGGA